MMTTAPSIETPIRKAPSRRLSATLQDHHYDALITAAVMAAILLPPLLILLGLTWLALTDPSTIWMMVSLYFQSDAS
jgi:uncharacterized RDD family membrane protein YckC